MVTSGFAWWFLSTQNIGATLFTAEASFQMLLFFASICILFVPFIIHVLMRVVPGRYLHGYEAAYQLEKERSKEEKEEKDSLWTTISGMFSGLWMIMRYPYVLGIFGMIFFWEIINVVFNFLRLGAGQGETSSIAGFGAFLYEQAFYTHLIGCLFVFIGTHSIIRLLGERKSLMLIPMLTGVSIGYYLILQTAAAAKLAYIVMRAVNYALAYPLRESLYIPTTKNTKFKAKSWIDGFGAKLSKGVGSYYNVFIRNFAPVAAFGIHTMFFGGIVLVWVVMAHFLGKRFETAIEKNEVVGE
jgi:AAA family ATP:ADP antiporter